VYLCAGWNLLMEIGMALEINLDKPERARKVGNELVGAQGPDATAGQTR
jgi:glucosamine--fructose-6-phosphate aminotransferase (isomerizing)